MSAPIITALTVTYGRVAWLQNAIADFLAQDYPNRRMVVLNTCPQQKLKGEFPNVRIINLDTRPPSLGDARNLGCAEAEDIIVTWDDDDSYLPHHLRTFAEAFDGQDWVWMDRQFWAMGENINSVVAGACPVFAFRKKVWNLVGGYDRLTVGEDRQFIGKVTAKCPGKKLAVESPSFVYRWGQGVYHASGMGDDKSGRLSSHDRVDRELKDRIARRQEPTGEIVLQPQQHLDWGHKARVFLESQKKTADENRICFVELGRYGDIVNILPILRHCAETYAKPVLAVSREFAPVLDGVSYVEPLVLDLKNDRINEAMKIVRPKFRHVANCQIWGTNFQIEKACASYNRESWRIAGFGHKFDDRTWLPLFDRRDRQREETLWKKLDDGRPMIVVNVTRSISSPFDGRTLLEDIRRSFAGCNVVDVSGLILPHIYDMVGLLEKAAALVSIDTALLHLAAATDVPVVALVNPAQWQGSELRCRASCRMTYREATGERLITAIKAAIALPRFNQIVRPLGTPPARAILHVVERHEERNPKELKRKSAAWASWDTLYAHKGVVPCHLWHYPRNALEIGDVRPLPYLKDLLRFGMDQAGDDDIIMWCNDDNVLHPTLPDILRLHVSLFGVCTSQRCEFHYTPMLPLSRSPDAFAKAGEAHMGRDLFATTKRWLDSHWDELPDFLLGASDFDLALACMVRLEFGIRTTRRNIETSMYPAELPRGYVSHQWHPPKWADPRNVNEAASQKWNRNLFKAWASLHLPELQFNVHGAI